MPILDLSGITADLLLIRLGYRGDATLSVVDIRGSKAVPQTVSESQDDELLSIVSIKGFVFDACLVSRIAPPADNTSTSCTFAAERRH